MAKRVTARSPMLQDHTIGPMVARLYQLYVTTALELEYLEIDEALCEEAGLTQELAEEKDVESWAPIMQRYAHSRDWEAYRSYNRSAYMSTLNAELAVQVASAAKTAAQRLGSIIDKDLMFTELLMEKLQIQIVEKMPFIEPKDLARIYNQTMQRMSRQQDIQLRYEKWRKENNEDGDLTLPEEILRFLEHAKELGAHSLLAFMASKVGESITGDPSDVIEAKFAIEPERRQRMEALEQHAAKRLEERRRKDT